MAEVVHSIEPEAAFTSCCRMTLLELPNRDRIVVNDGRSGLPVTCGGLGDVPNLGRADVAADDPTALGAKVEAVSGLALTYLGKLDRVERLADRLRSSTDGTAQECGLFIREAIAGTLAEADLAAFMGRRR